MSKRINVKPTHGEGDGDDDDDQFNLESEEDAVDSLTLTNFVDNIVLKVQDFQSWSYLCDVFNLINLQLMEGNFL